MRGIHVYTLLSSFSFCCFCSSFVFVFFYFFVFLFFLIHVALFSLLHNVACIHSRGMIESIVGIALAKLI